MGTEPSYSIQDKDRQYLAMRSRTLIIFAASLAFLLYSANHLRAFPTIDLLLLANPTIALIFLIVYSVIIAPSIRPPERVEGGWV